MDDSQHHLRLAGVIRLSLGGGRGPRDAYVFDPHRLALPAWACALGTEGPAALLVTLDRHLDLVVPAAPAAVPERAAGLRALDEHARWSLDVRNYDHVLAAMEAGLVGDALVLARARPRGTYLGEVYVDTRGRPHRLVVVPSVDRAAEAFSAPAPGDAVREVLEAAERVLLDVDLDCFTTLSDADPTTVLPWPRAIIRECLLPPGSEPFWERGARAVRRADAGARAPPLRGVARLGGPLPGRGRGALSRGAPYRAPLAFFRYFPIFRSLLVPLSCLPPEEDPYFMNGSPPQTVPPHLPRRVYAVVMTWLALSLPVTSVLVSLLLGLGTDEVSWSMSHLLPPTFIGVGVLMPWLGISGLLRRGFSAPPGEPPQERFIRLQKLPWQLSFLGTHLTYVFGGLGFILPLAYHFQKDSVLIALELLLSLAIGHVLSLPVALRLEQLLLPYVLEERARVRGRVTDGGPFWPRQRWYLPYTFATLLLSTLLLTALTLDSQTNELLRTQTQALSTDPALTPAQVELITQRLQDFSGALLSTMRPPLLALGLFVLLLPTFSAWMLARRHALAIEALQTAIEGLALGTPVAPSWVSTDELGDVAAGMTLALDRLQEIPTRLQASASLLLAASTGLGSASQQQRTGLADQAALLQEAQLTSEEIRTSSELASHKAENVLRVAGHAEQLGHYGEQSLEQTLQGLGTIRDFVDGIRSKVLRLQESATQIAHIAITVKDLADQSHLLALNASIEAARAGDQGAGFAVVASEIRKLADQTIRENSRIRKSLLDIGTAIRDVVSMSEQGARQVEGGLDRVRASGDNMREMSLIIQESAASVRQIAAAVNQQNTGISHIFNAIAHLSAGMDETVKRLDTTLQATETLQAVTREVTEIARKYQLQR